MVEELLSRSGSLGRETAKGIADAAMLEVASISVGHMVGSLHSTLGVKLIFGNWHIGSVKICNWNGFNWDDIWHGLNWEINLIGIIC